MPYVMHKTITDWYSFCRDKGNKTLMDNPLLLEGTVSGSIVEIEKSLFGENLKYNRGSGNQHIWVLGAVERKIVQQRDCATLLPIIKQQVQRGSKIYSDQWGVYMSLNEEGYLHETVNHSEAFKSLTGCCTNTVLQIIQQRDHVTLLPIIKQHVQRGSKIYLDQWGAYMSLNEERYLHETVNHSEAFKSPTGCCTSTVGGLWSLAKLKIKGVLNLRLPALLDEFM